MATFLDKEGVIFLWNKILTLVGGYVQKVDGMGLSSNDYTTLDMNKLKNIEEKANNYTLPTADSSTLGGVMVGYTQNGNNYPVQLNDGKMYVNVPNTGVTYGEATATSSGLLSSSDFVKLSEFQSASSYALKSDITNLYKYKGSVAAVANLPTSDNTIGDTYNVEATGMNYAWNGTAWDALGSESFVVEAITNTEIDEICQIS